MQIQELIDELIAPAGGRLEKTVDTVKAGDSSRETRHVGSCFMATAEVIRKARQLGVDFLITHEPTYYNHTDEDRPGHPVVTAKRQLVEESGLTIWRYHDYIHRCQPDGIVEGVLEALGWPGHPQGGAWVLDEPRTARQMAQDIKQRLGAGAVRATGDLDTPFSLVGMAVGDPGFNARVMDEIMMQGISGVFFFGEVSEWGVLEQVRDAAALGIPMAALTCGHLISEEMGMRLLAQRIAKRHPELTVDFIPTGEVYSYL